MSITAPSDNLSYTFTKCERLCRRKEIDTLFAQHNTIKAFPIRAIYHLLPAVDDSVPAVRVLISVPKRCLKRAVKRNRVKRQIREAYRQNKHTLVETLALSHRTMLLAVIWQDKQLHPSQRVNSAMTTILHRLQHSL